MNDIFKELARQAEFSENDLHTQGDNFQYFAELIVRECAGVELYWLNEQDRKAVAEKIKEHFGIEE